MREPFPTPPSQRYPHLQQNTHHSVPTHAPLPALPFGTFPVCQLVLRQHQLPSPPELKHGDRGPLLARRTTIAKWQPSDDPFGDGSFLYGPPPRSLMTTTFIAEEPISETREPRRRPALPNELAGRRRPAQRAGNDPPQPGKRRGWRMWLVSRSAVCHLGIGAEGHENDESRPQQVLGTALEGAGSGGSS